MILHQNFEEKLSKIGIFESKFKNEYFGQNLKFSSKLEILVTIKNFGKGLKFW